VIEDPPLPLDGWWPRERSPAGRAFMWGAAKAELALPPLAAGTELGVALRPVPGPDPVRLFLDGEVVAVVDGESEERRLWLHLPRGAAGRVLRLAFDRARGHPSGDGDARPLSVQVFEIRAVHSSAAWKGRISCPWQRQAIRVEAEGVFDAEQFLGVGDGVWLGPRAVLRLPASGGRLRLRMWAPRPTRPRTVIRLRGRLAAGPLEIGAEPAAYEVEVLHSDVVEGRLEVDIRSEPYRPTEDGRDDPRELGVVISEVAFEPREAAP
jgi:hypothetical protein